MSNDTKILGAGAAVAVLLVGALVLLLVPRGSDDSRDPEGTTTPSSSASSTSGPSTAHPTRDGTLIGMSYGETLSFAKPGKLDETLDDAVALGVESVRVDLNWQTIQPTDAATFDWSSFDRVVAAAEARRLEVLAVVAYTPEWAREPGCETRSFKCPPADPATFATFARAAAERYAPQGVHSWEIWNEPNFAAYWTHPTPTDYATLLEDTSKAIRKVDGGAEIVMGGLVTIDPVVMKDDSLEAVDFLEQVCDTGACDVLDGVAIHPYTWPYTASSNVLPTAPWQQIDHPKRSVRTVLDDHDLPKVKVWVTEFGAPTGGPGTGVDEDLEGLGPTTDHVSEDLQAVIAADGVTTAASDDTIAAFFWYTDQDLPYADTNVAYYGLRRLDGTKKPAWQAFLDAVSALR